MRTYVLYSSEPWLDTSNIGLETFCRSIFMNRQGCSDGYEKVWKVIEATWGDGELGGFIKVENRKIGPAEITVEAWKEEQTYKANKEFWSWYQAYDWLSSIIWNFVPTFQGIHVYTVGLMVDYWSFSETFAKGDMEEELKGLYTLLNFCDPYLGTIVSTDNKKPFEIRVGRDFQVALEIREVLKETGTEARETVCIYVPETKSYREFIEKYGNKLYQVLSELDTD